MKDLPESTIDTLTTSQVVQIGKDSQLTPIKVILRLVDWLSETMLLASPPPSPTVTLTAEKVEIAEEPACKAQKFNPAETSSDIVRGERNLKAVKVDGAKIPEYLWDHVLVPDENPVSTKALGHFRALGLRWWKHNVRRDFLKWVFLEHPALKRKLQSLHQPDFKEWNDTLRRYLRSAREAEKDWEAGRDCVARYCNASWWEWLDGSCPHFWRWKADYRKTIWDGLPPWFTQMPSPSKIGERFRDAGSHEEKVTESQEFRICKSRKVQVSYFLLCSSERI